MEKEIQQLQYMITQNDDDAFFRELEAERFKCRLHLASFQYSKNPFLWCQTSQGRARTEPVKQSKPEESFRNDLPIYWLVLFMK